MWSAVRLAYTAGGRVVAGSNPVIPTTIKDLTWLELGFLLNKQSFLKNRRIGFDGYNIKPRMKI